MARLSLDTVDRWTAGYALLVGLALVARWPLATPGAGLLPLAHLALLVLAFAATRRRRTSGSRWSAFLADFYPLLIATLLYTEVGLLNTLAGRSHDLLIQGWEGLLFGTQPSREWIRAWPFPWLSWPLHLAYLCYYVLVPGPALILWLRGQRAEARRVVLLVGATFYFCYAVFLFFPVAGPRYAFPLAVNAATTIAPALLTQRLLDAGAAWGTAFPSSHVAVSLVSTIRGGLAWHPIGYALVPLAVLLALGTVYGQFHYALDALAGTTVAAVALACDWRTSRTSGPARTEPER